MMAFGGDEFWDLHTRLGECYMREVHGSGRATFADSSQAMRRFRAMGEEGSPPGGARAAKAAWSGLEPPPPRSMKSLGSSAPGLPNEPVDTPATLVETWMRQISAGQASNPVSARSYKSPAFRDDFARAVQRKVTFDAQKALNMTQPESKGSLNSSDLEALHVPNLGAAMHFEPREYWRRQGSTSHLAAASATHRVFNTSRRDRRLSSSSVGRSSWDSVLSGFQILIHPNGRFRRSWSVLGMVFLTMDVVSIPLRFLDVPKSVFSQIMMWVTLLYWNLDIFVSFLTGYYYKGILVMNFRHIAAHYLKRWFMMDLGVVTVDWVMTGIFIGMEDGGAAGVARLSRGIRVLNFLRLVRVARMMRTNAILQHLEENTVSQATMTQYSLVKILGIMLLLQHVIACCWFGVGTLTTESQTWVSSTGLLQSDIWFQYMTCLHWAFAQLGVGDVEIEVMNLPERMFCIVVAVVSLVTTATLVSTITSLMTTLDKKRNDEMHQFWNLRRFLHYNNIPEELSHRITRFLQYAYHAQNECTSDADVPILALLSKGLQAELQFTRYETALSKLTFLSNLMSSQKQTPQEGKVLQSLAMKALYTVEFAQNDVVFCQGGIADAAFLALSGRFRYVRKGKGFIVGGDNWVAEMCLWTPWLYVGEMVAREISRSVAVEAEVFCECIGAVWETRQLATFYAQTVVEDLNTKQVEDLTDIAMVDEMVEEERAPTIGGRRDSRISSLMSFQASLERDSSWLWQVCCCCRRRVDSDSLESVAPSG